MPQHEVTHAITSNVTWTDERIERLKEGFHAGLSCRQIAAEIGVSRNAVIGKLSRLSLTRGKIIKHPARRRATTGGRAPAGPRLQYQMLRKVWDEARPTAPEEPIDSNHRCSLFELTEARCRWPVDTPGTTDVRFCGNVPLDGCPYCVGHARLAYRPDPRRRDARG